MFKYLLDPRNIFRFFLKPVREHCRFAFDICERRIQGGKVQDFEEELNHSFARITAQTARIRGRTFYRHPMRASNRQARHWCCNCAALGVKRLCPKNVRQILLVVIRRVIQAVSRFMALEMLLAAA
jgi:hypothetical protein